METSLRNSILGSLEGLLILLLVGCKSDGSSAPPLPKAAVSKPRVQGLRSSPLALGYTNNGVRLTFTPDLVVLYFNPGELAHSTNLVSWETIELPPGFDEVIVLDHRNQPMKFWRYDNR